MKQQRVQYYFDDFIRWTLNNEIHRDGDLPAAYHFKDEKIYVVSYRQHNKCHRTTGPAYINYVSKTKWYYYQGSEYNNLEEMLMIEACR